MHHADTHAVTSLPLNTVIASEHPIMSVSMNESMRA